jgi:Uma2 family endonuclease
MATKPALQHWTYDEYARLPDDGNRYEIVAGELCVSPSPRTAHQLSVVRLTGIFQEFTLRFGIGQIYVAPVDVLLSDTNYVIPDLAFVLDVRRKIVTDRGIEGAPDLVIEVLSPSTESQDRNVKREQYAEFGVPFYWIVDLDRRHIEVFRLAHDPHGPAEVVTDTLEWQPVPGGPLLAIPVPFVVGAAPR